MRPRLRRFQVLLFGLILAAVPAAHPGAQEPGLPEPESDGALDDLDLGDLGGAAATSGEAAGGEEVQEYWFLDCKVEALRTFTPSSGVGKGKVYWYMLYTLENNSKEDREFYLAISARSDRGRTYQDLFLPGVEREIERKLGRSFWGQTDRFQELADRNPEDPKFNYTTIAAGEKRSGIAVFNPLAPTANDITIEVYGLSNDVEAVPQEDGTTVLRQSVKVFRFRRVGDEYAIDQDPLVKKDQGWVKKELKVEGAGAS